MRRNHSCALLFTILFITTSAAFGQSFSVDVPAPDGALLATDVYLPFTSSPRPVVLIRTTYDKDDLAALCYPANLLGYACVAQDTRGRYASGGEDTVFRDDGDDGRATVQWIAEQTWCNGKIATVGASALGITQYLLTPGAPAELVCTMPMVATADLYHHAFLQGGCMRDALATNWLQKQDALHFLDEIRLHRLWDEWWQEKDAVSAVASVNVPALHLGGWYDIFQQGTIDGYTSYQHHGGAAARTHQYLVIGPWTHTSAPGTDAGELSYPANASFDALTTMEQWLDFCLKGDDDEIAQWSPVRIYLMGAVGESDAPGNRWLSLPDWPPATTSTAYHLAADGSLGRALPPDGSIGLTIDPGNPVPTLGGNNLFPDVEVGGRTMGAGPYDQRPVEARDDVLLFTSAVLDRPVTVMGRVSCRIWVVPDSLDMDLSVRLSDVYPDGRSMLVADGIQRARMRCSDDQECLLVPGVATELVVDLWSTALVFNSGHRIRVAVAGSNSPRFEINPNDGGDIDTGTPIIIEPTLLFGPENPSALVLPLLPSPRRADGRYTP